MEIHVQSGMIRFFQSMKAAHRRGITQSGGISISHGGIIVVHAVHHIDIQCPAGNPLGQRSAGGMRVGDKELRDIVPIIGKPDGDVLPPISEGGRGVLTENELAAFLLQGNGGLIAVLGQINLRRLRDGNQFRPVVVGIHGGGDADGIAVTRLEIAAGFGV
ncbi:hypothetical protein, partial [Pelotomaculum sp. PtaB.Bin117]|uniref:hypothetical protein n=1 Tax=Pelotomaculum sp. PtaB.Bin117 TaxID=1811694 RepID=UPI00257F723D